VLSENRYSTQGQAFAQEVRKRVDAGGGRAARAAVLQLDPSMPRQQVDENLARFSGCENYAIAAFASVTASRQTVGLAGELPHALELIIASGKPIAMAALGNPYLLRNFPQVAAYLATFSSVPPSEVAAVRALFGEISIRGHLPVSIPGLAKYRDGIQLQATRPLRGATQ